MRLRYVENAYEKMQESGRVILEPKEYKGKWKDLFNNNKPLHVEFGSGRGGFLSQMAKNNPDINYLAFERNSKVIVKGLNKLEDESIPNFYFVHTDIRELEEIFKENEVERVYINFPDPWPKKRHTKRRLTNRRFLDIYKNILIPKGEIHFKTDNVDLFDFSIEELNDSNWEIKVSTKDLHNSEYVEDNVMTEYEAKFVKQGKPINKLIAVSPKKDDYK
ncbi:tRNA (guanosine(46)-N7)-methyltransferase TrmB [Caldisalinibacter kiritimatiensis]|uniref:tRNA (guanosine(46)-N7)-methyltransferase TrmB n=1 Tax=Caldisalinibacter kiritimatiensis TaxID=1304284 RepID=UPI0005539CDC|nr:tRNA (guanosine(46)-N7)-methyltransferase TrmB [Caldisalinibacter kiritimatiensis]